MIAVQISKQNRRFDIFAQRNELLVQRLFGSNPVATLAGIGLGLPLTRASASRNGIWAICRPWWPWLLSSARKRL